MLFLTYKLDFRVAKQKGIECLFIKTLCKLIKETKV